MFRTRMVLATVLVALVGTVQAQAKIFVGAEFGIATSPTDVIGLWTDDEEVKCTDPEGFPGTRQVVASHDRGATWTTGACFSVTGPLMLDPVDGSVSLLTFAARSPQTGDYTYDLYLITFNREAGVAATRQIADPDARSGKAAAVIGGTVFIAESPNGSRLGAMRSVAPDGTVGTCATPPSTASRLLAMPNGVLLALSSDSNFELAAVSPDACKTWVKTPAKPGSRRRAQFPPPPQISDCTSIKLYSPVRAYLGCFPDGARFAKAYQLDFASPGAWKPARLAGMGSDGFDDSVDTFVPADESQVRIQPDSFGLPSWPAGWAAPAPLRSIGAKPPGGSAASVFAFVNDRYRSPMGLPDLGWSAAAAKAAQAHADYYAKNGYSGHNERRGKPGFTGATPSARCAKVGLVGCGEVAFEGTSLGDAVPGWLATPFHGVPFLLGTSMGLGSSKGGSVGNSALDKRGAYTIALGAPPNTPGSAIKVWPADGMTNIPTRWLGGEKPNPLRRYKGNKKDVGPTFFATSELPMTLSLTKAGSAKKVPLMVVYSAKGSATLRVVGGFGAVVPFLPTEQLATGTKYVLTAKVAGKTHTFSFTTAKGSTPTA